MAAMELTAVPEIPKCPPRVRSASTGPDKKSDLKARYWSLLFGNLQRAVNEIYQTVECYENLSSCQETILVLENYIRDFKALAAWFQVSWDYEATPKPDQRRSLAWEVRKCNPVPPKLRSSKNLSSPAISATPSPSNSPCPPIAEQLLINNAFPVIKLAHPSATLRTDWPYIQMRNSIFGHEHPTDSQDHLRQLGDLSSWRLNSPRLVRSASLVEMNASTTAPTKNNNFQDVVEFTENKRNQYSQTLLDEDHLTLAAYRKKYNLTFCKQQAMASGTMSIDEEDVKTRGKPGTGTESISTMSPKKATSNQPLGSTSKITTIVKKSMLSNNRNRLIGSTKRLAPASSTAKDHSIEVSTFNCAISKSIPRFNDSTGKYCLKEPMRARTMIEMPPKRNINPVDRSSRDDMQKSNNNRSVIVKCPNTPQRSRKSEPPGGGGDANIYHSNNDQGWLTVKSKRRTSWSSRYNKPTGSASMPTLTLYNQYVGENNKDSAEISDAGKKVQPENDSFIKERGQKPATDSKSIATGRALKAKTGINLKSSLRNKPTALERSCNTHGNVSKFQVNTGPETIVRQKSDLTGLKIKCLHREYMRIEKIQGVLKHNRKTHEDGLNSIKVDMNIQTVQDQNSSVKFSSVSGDDEDNDLILEENDDDQRKLLEEQENLERQIRELENTEIEVDTETDETDYEVLVENDDEDVLFGNKNDLESENIMGDIQNITDENMSLEMKYHLLLSEIALGERLQTLATLEAFVARHPGRAQELHQKLSSPSRRRSLHETLKKYQVKQTRAAEKREALLKEKAHKIQLLLARVEDVKQAKQQLIDERRLRMEERLQRATENRTQFLKDKVKKAHDEDEKLREIAFIKSLTEQNRRLDLLESSKEHDLRMHDLEQERQKRVEEKAAKEAAAERRRLEIEQERRRRLELISETRREREKRVGKIQQQKEQERQLLATQKAKDREERLQALQAAQHATTKELQRKIDKKLQESTKRHIVLIEHIRQRAQELGIPSRNNDDALSTHTESDLSSRISDVVESSKGHKKKLKKIKQRLQEKTEEYLRELPVLKSHHRRDSEVPKILSMMQKGVGAHGYERPLGQLLRIVSKAQPADFHCLLSLDALGVIAGLIKEGSEPTSDVSRRARIMAVQLYRNICSICPQLNMHAVMGNSICILFGVLYTALQIPDEITEREPVELSTELMLCCTVAVSVSVKHSMKYRLAQSVDRFPDVLSYAVLIGLVGALTKRCAKVREPVEQHQGVILSLLATIGLLTNFAQICPKGPLDSTRYLSVAIQTELFGVITLLHSTIFPFGETIPSRTISLAAAILNLLVTMADLDLVTFQTILNEQVLVLKYLDVATVLLKYCSSKAIEKGETQAVIIDLIGTLGFFCANNKRNQDLLASPAHLTILKSVIKLPKLLHVAVYPTIVAVTWRNAVTRKVISEEFDVQSLDDYQNSELAKRNKLIGLLK